MSATLFHSGRVTLYAGDCLDVLDTLPENSVDSCVCDPPYHLTSIVKRFGTAAAVAPKEGTNGAFRRAASGFMNKQWDGGDIAFQIETWAKVLRVLKPGAYIVAFSSSRTFGRMSVAIEDAGFITHPMIGWIFGSGFPKATRVRAEGYEGHRYGGQALKPALEPIYVGQKPFSEKNGTANILRWGTGAVNIDGCRIGATRNVPASLSKNKTPNGILGEFGSGHERELDRNLGRWPANLVHDGSPEVVAAFPANAGAGGQASGVSLRNGNDSVARGRFNGLPDGIDPAFHNDSGSAARFFYQAKADSTDRLNSRHPTVKPLDLMRWLVRLVTPKGGLVLDCFAGTGSTAHAALIEGMRAILIEREPEYQADIANRMGLVFSGSDERARKLAKPDSHESMPLFGAAE